MVLAWTFLYITKFEWLSWRNIEKVEEKPRLLCIFFRQHVKWQVILHKSGMYQYGRLRKNISLFYCILLVKQLVSISNQLFCESEKFTNGYTHTWPEDLFYYQLTTLNCATVYDMIITYKNVKFLFLERMTWNFALLLATRAGAHSISSFGWCLRR